jgi:hypothetical protein
MSTTAATGFDWTTLIPLLGAVVGIAGTIAGISVKAVFDRRIERARVAREKAEAEKSEKAQAQGKAEERARAIADLFLDELKVVRGFDEGHSSVGFPIWYEKRWRTEGDIPFRRLIATVRESDERNQLVDIIDSMDDFQSLAQWKSFWNQDRRWVEDTLTLGFDLASTMARGQKIDPELLKRWIDFRRIVVGYQDYQEEQRELAAEQRKSVKAKKDKEAAAKAFATGAKPKPRTTKPGPSPRE